MHDCVPILDISVHTSGHFIISLIPWCFREKKKKNLDLFVLGEDKKSEAFQIAAICYLKLNRIFVSQIRNWAAWALIVGETHFVEQKNGPWPRV
ncbi:hypothetical protein CEXT_537851 [Caerostris extrusa]|uniref:Uncharacterized protein n=1 Tax=Caerostris extrusa TaxID=172846 RepID=A0AAV4MPG5_CAEEX|nr:hypothetical protein CEXT_537851 [Caerostris extrusa]